MKPESIWKNRVRDTQEQGKDWATEVCGAGTVSGTLITIKFGKKTALVLTFRGLLAFGYHGQHQRILPTPCPRSKGYLSFSAHLTLLVQSHFVH